jgi:protein ImuB
VISHRDRNTQRIAALDERAEALRLKRGMGIADARAMHPSIDIVEADPEADRRLLEGLADWCDRYTPLKRWTAPMACFSTSPAAPIFRRRTVDAGRHPVAVFHQMLSFIRAGLAATPGAAWAAARFSGSRIVASGEEEALLAPLPLSALRIEPAIRASLESVGLRTAGAVMAAPRAPLARRFGASLLLRLDQALGRLDEAVSPRLPVAPLSVERHLCEPIMLTEDQAAGAVLAVTLRRTSSAVAGAQDAGAAALRVDGISAASPSARGPCANRC